MTLILYIKHVTMFRYLKEKIVTLNEYMESLNREIEAMRNKDKVKILELHKKTQAETPEVRWQSNNIFQRGCC